MSANVKHKTAIEWTHVPGYIGATLNPIRARNKETGKAGHFCVKVSPGCVNCYAERLQGWPFHSGIQYRAQDRDKVEVYLDEAALLKPLGWKQPHAIFLCDMTDPFGDWVPDDWLDKIFAVAALCPHHIFFILTKRSKRLRKYCSSFDWDRLNVGRQIIDYEDRGGTIEKTNVTIWPMPNVWLGVSAEDQARADERRDDLKALAEAGWTTFVSYEPALGPVDWAGWEFLKQLISGGESGPGARPSHPDWHRAARDFCARHGIAYFFKQWGEWAPQIGAINLDDDPERSRFTWAEWTDWGGGPARWEITEHPQWCNDMDADHCMIRVGKKAAGAMLDGREHREFPK